MKTNLIKYLGCILIGILIAKWLFTPEIETKTEIKEVRTTDTVYVQIRDTVHVTRTEIKYEHLRYTFFEPEMNV